MLPRLTLVFLSTLSLRRATYRRQHTGCIWRNFYPRSPCGERHNGGQRVDGGRDFYPRSPCGERRPVGFQHSHITGFLSTLSLRRATQKLRLTLSSGWYFYPRSPCGERRYVGFFRQPHGYFYPRSSCGERRITCKGQTLDCRISIHALLAESDNGISRFRPAL